MRCSLLAFGLVACGGGQHGDTRVVARDAIAKAVSDVGAMTSLFADSVVNGGLWFEDPACKALPLGAISKDKHAELARCLVSLKLQPSAREDALRDVVVMTYAPGFEVQVRIANESKGPRLSWVGFSSRRESEKHPTISGDVLEASRLAGEADGPLDATVTAALDGELQGMTEPVAFTWLKVCIDGEGSVVSAEPYETTSIRAQTAFRAVALTWKFKPFLLKDNALPVCAMKRLSYPPGAAPLPETIPPPAPRSRSNKEPLVLAPNTKLLEGRRIAGTNTIVPDDQTKVEIQKANQDLEGRFRFCIDEQGSVESVQPFRSTGYEAYDRRLIAGIQGWRYTPFLVGEQPVPVCTTITFRYRQDASTQKIYR